jgi:hypothetical protein
MNDLQNSVRHGTSYVVKIVMNAIGSKGSNRGFNVVSFVVDGKVETEL